MDSTTLTDLFGEVIHSYTRAQAIEDGVLVDVTEAGREVGFKWPVAITRAAWADTVEWTEADEKRKPEYTGQDERGRLHDVVWMAAQAVRRGPKGAELALFPVHRVPAGGRGIRPKPVELVVVVGPGDQGEPVITIMQPGES